MLGMLGGGEVTTEFARLRRRVRHLPTSLVLDHLPGKLTQAVVEAGILNSGKVDPRESLCAAFVSAGWVAVYRRWLMEGGSISPEEVSHLTSTLALEGLKGVAAQWMP